METVADLIELVEELKASRDRLFQRVEMLEATVIRVTSERDRVMMALRDLTHNVTSWPARVEAMRLLKVEVRAEARP